ncbi:MAG: tetratricopeptide repeat-containing sensor histidine kinase [Chitinophagales bacterium]
MEHLNPQQAKKLLSQIPSKTKQERFKIYQQVFSTPPYHNSLELDPDGAFHEEYTQLAEEFGDRESVFKAWREIIMLYLNDTTNFSQVYNRAMMVFEQEQDVVYRLELQLSKTQHLFGLGRVHEAVELLDLGLEAAKYLENKSLIFDHYYYMSAIVSENREDRIRYAKEALNYVTSKNQIRAWILEGDTTVQEFKYYEAREAYGKLEEWAVQENNEYILLYAYMGVQRAISIAALDKRVNRAEYSKLEQVMREYLHKGIALAKELGSLQNITETCSYMANFYYNCGRFNDAIHHYERTLAFAKQYGCRKDIEKDDYFQLYDCNKKIGNFEKALEAYEKYTALKEEMYSVETQNKIAELNTTFEAEKREEEIARLTKENELLETIKAQKEKLEQLNLTKDQIFSIIGHDMRKPAIAFRGIGRKVNYLLKKQDYPTLIRLGNKIEQEALALNQLTDNLLNWAILQKDVLSYHPQSVNIAAIVCEIGELFDNMAKEKNIELLTDIDSNLTVYANENALRVIVRNLLDNALKFTSNGGKVNITAFAVDSNIQLQISDTGVGISPEKLPHIFLLQKDKSTQGTAGEKGTGMGLYLINELVQFNKGIIEVFSQLGSGTSFKVLLPRA